MKVNAAVRAESGSFCQPSDITGTLDSEEDTAIRPFMPGSRQNVRVSRVDFGTLDGMLHKVERFTIPRRKLLTIPVVSMRAERWRDLPFQKDPPLNSTHT